MFSIGNQESLYRHPTGSAALHACTCQGRTVCPKMRRARWRHRVVSHLRKAAPFVLHLTRLSSIRPIQLPYSQQKIMNLSHSTTQLNTPWISTPFTTKASGCSSPSVRVTGPPRFIEPAKVHLDWDLLRTRLRVCGLLSFPLFQGISRLSTFNCSQRHTWYRFTTDLLSFLTHHHRHSPASNKELAHQLGLLPANVVLTHVAM